MHHAYGVYGCHILRGGFGVECVAGVGEQRSSTLMADIDDDRRDICISS